MKIGGLNELIKRWSEVWIREIVVRVLRVKWRVLWWWRRSTAAGGAAGEAWRLSVHFEEVIMRSRV